MSNGDKKDEDDEAITPRVPPIVTTTSAEGLPWARPAPPPFNPPRPVVFANPPPLSDLYDRTPDTDRGASRSDASPPVGPRLEADFLNALRASPSDEDTRLVYADWLEEHGAPEKAEFLRLQSRLPEGGAAEARARKLASSAEWSWRVIMSRPAIERCNRDECLRRWDALEPTEDDAVRRCVACKASVHYCSSILDVVAKASKKQLVVLDLGLDRRDAMSAYASAMDNRDD
jgi:uncharacterized protein (TIGR02996 family)